jgi:hypothetical protein
MPSILFVGSGGPSQMMTRKRFFAAALGVLAAVAGGCHRSFMPSLATPNTSCGDPCAAMVCPSGDRCSWNNACQPRCEAQPLPSFGH